MISIVIPCYNSGDLLRDSIESILVQTYRDIELILINDGSTDSTYEVISDFSNNNKVKIINNKKNYGLISTLNEGIEASQGDFIARMDHDDISHSRRLEYQLKEFRDPNLFICGTDILINNQKRRHYPIKNRQCKTLLFLGNCFAHPTVMMRASTIRDNKIYYNHKYKNIEDYGFWVENQCYGKYKNIPKPLLSYRIVESGMSVSVDNSSFLFSEREKMRIEILKHHFQLNNIILQSNVKDDFFRNLIDLKISGNELKIIKKIMKSNNLSYEYLSVMLKYKKFKNWGNR